MIDPTIDQAVAPSRASWKDNIYQSKAFAFLTSSALARALLLVALAVSYVLLKMPSPAPQTELPTVQATQPAPVATVTQPVKKTAKPIVKQPLTVEKQAAPQIPVKPIEPPTPAEQEFAKKLATFESKL